jgi:hypothetical protein
MFAAIGPEARHMLASMRLQLAAPTGHPDFLDFPWSVPLEEWSHERLVEVSRGISRHVVRFVSYGDALYAFKELPERLARREYALLRRVAEESMPVVEAVGVVSGRRDPDGGELDAILITRHLEFALPYRLLFTGRSIPDLRNSLLDALAQLLARLHLIGFFWGDCSLSNALFRRDAGALAAYLVDAETAEMHPHLSDGQREHDVTIAEENIAGELMDVDAEVGLPEGLDPLATAEEIRSRYGQLWSELTKEEIFSLDERYRIDGRMRRLHELGYDVEEVELESVEDGYRLKLHPLVVEPGHHRRRLFGLTGLDVQENQARRLLNDLDGFRCHLNQAEERTLPESVVAYRWLSEAFEPAIEAVPAEVRTKLDPAELYHELLEHRWFLSESAGRDVGIEDVVESYVENVLRPAPDERTVLPAPSS